MIKQIKEAILKSLIAADDVPFPDEALISAVSIMVHPRPARAQVIGVIETLETGGLTTFVDDDIKGKFWILTTAGKLRAQTL